MTLKNKTYKRINITYIQYGFLISENKHIGSQLKIKILRRHIKIEKLGRKYFTENSGSNIIHHFEGLKVQKFIKKKFEN